MSKSRKLLVCLALALSLGAVSAGARAQGSKWWQHPRYQTELGLSPDQISRIEDVFQAAQPELRAQKRALDKLEDELSRLVGEAVASEAEVEQFVSRVEVARADLNKSRTLMLFRIRRILTTEQHVKLKELHEHDRRNRSRRGSGGL